MSDVTTDTVEKTIDAVEQQRSVLFKHYVLQLSCCMAIMGLAIATILAILFIDYRQYVPLSMNGSLVVLICCAGVCMLTQYCLHRIRRKAQIFKNGDAKRQILTAVLAPLQVSEIKQGDTVEAQSLYQQAASILPDGNIIEYGDYFEIDGATYLSLRIIDREVKVENRKTRIEHYLLFEGFIMVTNTKPVKQDIRVVHDAGLFNGLRGFAQGMQRIALEDPIFEKRFEVYGTDQVESRKILMPKTMMDILEIDQIVMDVSDAKQPYRKTPRLHGHALARSRQMSKGIQLLFQGNQCVIACALRHPLWMMPPIYKKWGAPLWRQYLDQQLYRFVTLSQHLSDIAKY